MPRTKILGELNADLACAIAAGFVEQPRVVANVDTITLHDEHMRQLGSQRGWLDAADPLDAATRDYLTARRDAMLTGARGPAQTAWNAAAAVKARDEANRRAVQAKGTVRQLLEERNVFALARLYGLRILA